MVTVAKQGQGTEYLAGGRHETKTESQTRSQSALPQLCTDAAVLS